MAKPPNTFMAARLKSLLLQAYSLLPPFPLQLSYGFYRVELWLGVYHPLFVSAKLVERLQDPTSDERTRAILVSAIIMSAALCNSFCQSYFPSVKPLLQQDADRQTASWKDRWQSAEDSKTFQTDPHPTEGGLSETEVLSRRQDYGPNVLRSKRDWLHVFITFCKGSYCILIESAALASMLRREWLDLFILCVILLRSLHGTIQSVRAYEDIARCLDWDLSTSAVVLRGGELQEVNITELVPGDVVYVSEGCMVPADVRLITSEGAVNVNQSNITGQTEVVSKLHGDICFLSSRVLHGDAFAVVLDTGARTFVGRALACIGDPVPDHTSKAGTRTDWLPFDMVEYYGLLHAVGICFLIVMMIAVGTIIFSQKPQFLLSYQILGCALALLVIVNPSSQEHNIHTIRNIGTNRLMQDGALVKSTINGETLAGIDLLCVDKTGTITENRLTVYEPYCINCTPEELMLTACLAVGDETPHSAVDKALFRALKRYPEAKAKLNYYKIFDKTPFNIETKRTMGSIESPTGERMLCSKGAPLFILRDVFLHDNPEPEGVSEAYRANLAEATKRGFRCVGVARRRENARWELLGLIRMSDAPRYDSAAGIRLARSLGISIKILTGDTVELAAHITKIVGLGADLLSCQNDAPEDFKLQSHSELAGRVDAADGFTEVLPIHKENIVRILRSCGRILAVTGDAVNDAPALMTAHCGIAVDGASDRARSVAGITQYRAAGLAPLIQAVQTSRQTFQQVYNYLAYRTILMLQCLALWTVWHLRAATASSGGPLHLGWLVMNIHFTDIVWTASMSHEASTPFSKTPIKWICSDFLLYVASSTILLSISSFFGLLSSSRTSIWESVISTMMALENADRKPSVLPAQAFWLCSILTGHWQYILLRTRCRFWLHRDGLRKLLVTILIIDIAATLLCVLGWIDRSADALSFTQAGHVWLTAALAICTAWALSFVLWSEPYIGRQLITNKGVNYA